MKTKQASESTKKELKQEEIYLFEQTFLAGMLVAGAHIESVITNLKPEHFSVKQHGDIYRAMIKCYVDNNSVDVFFLAKESGVDLKYLLSLAVDAVSGAHIETYADHIINAYKKREIKKFAQNIIDVVNTTASAKDVLNQAEESLFNLATEGGYHDKIETLYSLKDSIDDLIEGKVEKGLQLGIKSLDDKILGVNAGNFVIVGARPAVGKTAFALNIARKLAISGKQVLFFSLEMQPKELASRLLSQLTEIPHNKIRTGDPSIDKNLIKQWTSKTPEEFPLLIEGMATLRPTDVVTIARKVYRKNGLKLIIIDYLQLMVSDNKRDNRVIEVTEITRALKCLANELKIPVIALSQFSRRIETAENKDNRIPQLSDLRDSGSIEQDADIVLALHKKKDGPAITEVDLHILKHRHGETGKVGLDFIKERLTFTERIQESHSKKVANDDGTQYYGGFQSDDNNYI